MNPAWRGLADEAARWQDAGRELEFWWRDDDAQRPTPSLERLLELAARSSTPLTLAVIPREADAAMLAALAAGVTVIQHGTDHVNRAAAGAKKTEFPPQETLTGLAARLEAGRRTLAAACGRRFVPVLAPPWNRLAGDRLEALGAAGLRGLSQFGHRRTAAPLPDLRLVNTHVDIIDWKHDRRFAGEEASLLVAQRHLESRRTGLIDAAEPTGWLTHHACHDEAAWSFLEQLFDFCCARPWVRWRTAQELFHVA